MNFQHNPTFIFIKPKPSEINLTLRNIKNRYFDVQYNQKNKLIILIYLIIIN